MIAARLYDGLTVLMKDRRVPGMDRAWFREADCEEDSLGERIEATNRDMALVDQVTVAPWPDPVCSHAPLDASDRIDGIRLRAAVWSAITGEAHATDEAHLIADVGSPNPLAVLSAATVRDLTAGPTLEELREKITDADGAYEASRWARLAFLNEDAGHTDLREPLWAVWESVPTGAGLALQVGPEQDHVAPFDLAHPERYQLAVEKPANADGLQRLPDADAHVADHVLLEQGGKYALYLRPRRWRWFVTVIAHYIYVDPFFEWPSDEIFLAVFWDRPPFWPARHDITYTRQPDAYQLYNFYGEPRSYDGGIDSKWSLSRAAARMAHEILSQQWESLCAGYFFTGNENPDILIQSDAPRSREAVLGIGRVDAATGAETRTWVVQAVNLDALYPRQTIGQFIANWQATD